MRTRKMAPGLSDRAWIWLFAMLTAAIFGFDLVFASSKWVGYFASAAMALVTACFCLDQLGKAKPQLRLSWGLVIAALLLTAIGYFYVAADFFNDASSSAGHLVTLTGFNRYATYTVAKMIPLVFLFSQIEDGDDSLYFRAIDVVQSILIVSLVILVFTPTLMGGAQNSFSEARWLRAAAHQMVLAFGIINWLGRKPGEDRRLVGAINCYFIVKVVYNSWILTTTEQAVGQEGAGLANVLNSNDVLADCAFLIAILYGQHHSKLIQASRTRAREAMRVLNPLAFTAALLALSFVLGVTLPRWGVAVAALAVFLYVLRSVRWLSDFRRLQRKSIEAAQNKAKMLMDISHEIRAPLASVTLYASRLYRQAGLDAEQAAMAKIIHQGGELVISTLNDALDASLLEAKLLQVRREPFDVVPIVQEVVELLEAQALANNVGIAWTPAKFPPLIGDPKRMRQVLINILANAIRHAPAETDVIVAVERVASSKGTAGRIVITDHGDGIAQDRQDLLFRRFSQLGEGGVGTSGLGLAISSDFAKLMGGHIAFESKAGRTSFWIELASASG